MEWLLKIVEGPMSGAEIALVAGLRVRVGSGADCDIVLADASVPETAFELDVSADSVSLVRGEDVRTLVSLEIVEVGTTAFAVGPADTPWGPLKRADEAKVGDEGDRRTDSPSEDGASPEKAGLGKSATAGDASALSADASADATSPSSGETGSGSASDLARSARLRLFGWILLGVLTVAAAVLVWLFWPRVAACCPWAETARLAVVNVFTPPPPPPVVPGPTLADIAKASNLTLSEKDGVPVLSGNLARRTERLAIRSLALAENPQVRLELTDDETLAAAASELMFVVTEGAIKVVSASNCVVTLSGYAPNASSLEQTIRALDADVKGIERVVTTAVRVGGPPPVVAHQGAPEAKPVQRARARKAKIAAPNRNYPIAGILTKPFAMVVLDGGMRLAEGAQIGNVTVERIEADKLILREGTTVFEWRP